MEYLQKKLDATYFPVYRNVNHLTTSKKRKIEFFYNKRALSMFFRGNGLVGENVSSMIIDNLKLYEVDMIPFFQYFNTGNINKSVYVPYVATAPRVGTENEFSQGDASPYGFDSFVISQPSGEITIQAESAAAAAQAASESDPAVAAAQSSGGSSGGAMSVGSGFSDPNGGGPNDPFGVQRCYDCFFWPTMSIPTFPEELLQ